MARALLIHIGYHKTGTTWLQKMLFRENLGYRPIVSGYEAFEYFVKPHGLDFQASDVAQDIKGKIDTPTTSNVDVISSEVLCGNPFFGGHGSDEYARRIKACFPHAQILIGIREQLSALRSVYMQYLSRGGSLAPKEFFKEELTAGYNGFDPDHFKYHRLVALYKELFGAENVLVITQEELLSDEIGVVKKLNKFTGNEIGVTSDQLNSRKVAPSYPESVSPLLRRINHFRAGPAHKEPVFDFSSVSSAAYRVVGTMGRHAPLSKLLKKYKPVQNIVADKYTGYYSESNKILVKMIGCNVNLSLYEGFR